MNNGYLKETGFKFKMQLIAVVNLVIEIKKEPETIFFL
jgi:hypothetical protein